MHSHSETKFDDREYSIADLESGKKPDLFGFDMSVLLISIKSKFYLAMLPIWQVFSKDNTISQQKYYNNES
jgi:hypothetical protein